MVALHSNENPKTEGNLKVRFSSTFKEGEGSPGNKLELPGLCGKGLNLYPMNHLENS